MRRISSLSDLGARLLSARCMPDLCRMSCDVLRQLDHDLPYCIAYTRITIPKDDDITFHSFNTSSGASTFTGTGSQDSSEGNRFVFMLEETVGCPFDCAIAPMRIAVDLDDETPSILLPLINPWINPIRKMCQTGQCVEIPGIGHLLDGIPHRGIPGIRPYRAVCMPLKHGSEIVGCFICLLNPASPWESEFQMFMSVLERQLSLSTTMVKTYEHEVRRYVNPPGLPVC
jgi:hypothetical protein